MSDEKQILTPSLERTIEIDPIRNEIEFDLDVYRKVFAGAVEGTDDYKMQKKLVEAKQKQLDEYQSNGDGPRITIGYMPAEMITELDILEDESRTHPRNSAARARAVAELDRLAAKWGIKGHHNCKLDGAEVPFDVDDNKAGEGISPGEPGALTQKLAGPGAVGYYERRRWLRSLRWRIWRYNTLQEEKKSK